MDLLVDNFLIQVGIDNTRKIRNENLMVLRMLNSFRDGNTQIHLSVNFIGSCWRPNHVRLISFFAS